MSERWTHIKRIRHSLNVIALWQLSVFVLLLLMIWTNEILSLSETLFGTPRAGGPDYFAASLLSAFVLLAAVISIGQTYVKQQALLSGFITICAKCHKVRVNKEIWEGIERYIVARADVEFSHGLCPSCYEDAMAEAEEPAVSG